jgi:branched-chain amino acid aminotransferase
MKVQLQKPRVVSINGKLRPWDEATLHIGCEAVTRGLNVFEGVKGYWSRDGRFAIVLLRAHYARLQRSARLLHIPCRASYEDVLHAISDLARELLEPDRDMWFRPTLYVTEGHWGEGTEADLITTAFQQSQALPAPVDLGVSTWRRSIDVALPARIKTSSNYQVARLARIEGRRSGYDDMILLNQWGRVAEATASCILMVRDGRIITPPASEGALESITIDAVEILAKREGIPFDRRPIERTELLVADEVAVCGTLAEVVLARSIEGAPLSESSPLLRSMQDLYFKVVRGEVHVPEIPLSVIESAPAEIGNRGR